MDPIEAIATNVAGNAAYRFFTRFFGGGGDEGERESGTARPEAMDPGVNDQFNTMMEQLPDQLESVEELQQEVSGLSFTHISEVDPEIGNTRVEREEKRIEFE